MEFDKNRVYTALNADESLIGAKGYFGDTLIELKYSKRLRTLTSIKEEGLYPDDNTITGSVYNFFYLVEPAPKTDDLLKEKTIEKVCSKLSGAPSDYFKAGIEYARSVPSNEVKEECSTPRLRPFKDCDELVQIYISKIPYFERNYYSENKITMPFIWVKSNKARFIITCFGDGGVSINGSDFVYFDELFNKYTFLDGTPCGAEA